MHTGNRQSKQGTTFVHGTFQRHVSLRRYLTTQSVARFCRHVSCVHWHLCPAAGGNSHAVHVVSVWLQPNTSGTGTAALPRPELHWALTVCVWCT